ncbi:hypothetical protein [Rugamonas rubra]|uniref:Uncharacterized protein n=1 Tax=Rugamonas rubra TaxID=758825 RepID=A0A1I4R945_9BURK|nr:hypothetical protein [Rugamonas rubra]SFM48767.1 hypothetical protein SAMN02982985_04261 [Rugamonas rubra]
MANPNMDGYWLAFSQAYFAADQERDYFEGLAKSSILEEDKIRFFQAALQLKGLVSQMESANAAAIDRFNKTSLKGPSDDTLATAKTLATAFAAKIAVTAKTQTAVTLTTKFLSEWTKLGAD